MREQGFTAIELVVIIVVIGVLAVSATARFADTEAFEVRGFRDQLASAARDAQRYARNSGCPTSFSIAANSYSVTTSVPCGGGSQTVTGFSGPLTGAAPAGVSVTAAAVTFDAYGAPNAGGIITVSKDGNNASFTIQAGSGYVNMP